MTTYAWAVKGPRKPQVFKIDKSGARRTERLFDRQPERMPRCIAFTQGPGGGYKGPHQCTHRAVAYYHSLPLCMCHMRRALNPSRVRIEEVTDDQ